jgi:hypothetical protein
LPTTNSVLPPPMSTTVLAIGHRHGLQHAEVDQPFSTPEITSTRCGLSARPRRSRRGHGLAHGAVATARWAPVHVGGTAHAGEGWRCRSMASGSSMRTARAVTEAHRLLLAGEHLDATARVDAGHDHVDGVRADVDGRLDVAADRA